MPDTIVTFPRRILQMAARLMVALVAIVAFCLGAILVLGALTDFRPAGTEPLTPVPPRNKEDEDLQNENIYSFLIWNIGYAGLGREADLFHDGGKMVFPGRQASRKNLEGIKGLAARMQNVDFLLFQEVDKNAKRSYYQNQAKQLSDTLSQYFSTFATNYKAAFIPYPFSQPYGKVFSGLLTLSRLKPEESMRYSLPSEYPWPVSMFFVKRCFLIQRFKVNNGKELLLINTHKSAYDNEGKVKEKQMIELKKIIIPEYERGNYVVVGGDWNQFPPGYREQENMPPDDPALNVPDDFMPQDWQWVFDSKHPTNRKMHMPYEPGVTPTQLLDFFLISPNVEVIASSTIDQQFEFSDHHPVYMRVRFK
ncbi:hypothetical protein C7N43_23725 [Sphingobacteriales bacterium UPWRP_1]|nr:hypothetical protein BVG80_06695 [Sphingobacteriales bacterium TSM_CSM]PSJ74501.1 hypothetical protein C7N43_23725 [Sphingobacteriales bacterium UPWRP_1]